MLCCSRTEQSLKTALVCPPRCAHYTAAVSTLCTASKSQGGCTAEVRNVESRQGKPFVSDASATYAGILLQKTLLHIAQDHVLYTTAILAPLLADLSTVKQSSPTSGEVVRRVGLLCTWKGGARAWRPAQGACTEVDAANRSRFGMLPQLQRWWAQPKTAAARALALVRWDRLEKGDQGGMCWR